MKIIYTAQIGTAGLSSKEKSCRHSIGRNFDQIVLKIVIRVGIIKPQIEFENELCGANRRGRTFLKKFPRGRNYDSFFSSNLVNWLI